VLYCCVELAVGLVQSELLDAGAVVEVSSGLSVVVASWVVSMGEVVVGPPVGVVSENGVVVWKLSASVVESGRSGSVLLSSLGTLDSVVVSS